MKFIKILFLFGLLIFLSCKSQQKLTSTSSPSTIEQSTDYSTCQIKAFNLSEDMSSLATNNDELIILIYAINEEGALTEPLCSKSLVLDTLKFSAQFQFEKISHDFSKDLLIYLIEMDTDKTIVQIEPTVRLHHQSIMEAFAQRDSKKLKELLGDDDLLGIRKISSDKFQEVNEFTIEGIQKMDRFEYRITIIR